MLQTRKIGAKHYYEYLPDLSHRCGDIWTSLPSQGLLGIAPISGLVITPACDLANRKTETIIYLPIVPLRSYFCSSGALPEVRSRIFGLLKAGKYDPCVDWPESKFLPLPREYIDLAVDRITHHLGAKQRGKAEISALERAISGFRIVRRIANGELGSPPGPDLKSLFGSDWDRIKVDIITNSYRPDLYFLPKDEQGGGFAGLANHSLVLFRYPVTAPTELLDLAQSTPDGSWRDACTNITKSYPAASAFASARPLKVLSLKSEFLSDLLSRYCAVYSRVGSPDFSKHSLLRISAEVDN